MSRKVRRSVLVLFVVLLVLSVAAVQAQDPVQVTVLGTIKTEIATQFADAVAAFNASQDQYEVVIIPLDGDPVQRMTTLSASGNMPTIISMGQEFSLFKDTLLDVTDAEFSQHALPGTQNGVTIDGRIFGMPVTVEAFGLLYNQSVLDAAVGGTFDPSTIATQADLQALLEQVAAVDAVEAPVHLSPMDWSLGAHFSNILFTDQSDTHEGRVAFLDGMKAGDVTLADNTVYSGWLDTLDLLMQYNQNGASPLDANYDDGALALGTGEVGLWFMGNWATPTLKEIAPDTDFGILPVPISGDASTYGNTQISVGVPLNLVIDASQSTPEQQAGAIAFLNWFVTDPTGQDFWLNSFNFIPVYDTFESGPADALSLQILDYVADGLTLEWMNNLYPAGGWQAMGASMQKYLVGAVDRAGLADELQAYWATVE